jgi:hypothetical protein
MAVGSAGARATAALELLLAATIDGTALRRNPLRSFAAKVLLATIHIGVSASSDTGSKIFTTLYRSIWVAPFTTRAGKDMSSRRRVG